MSEHAAVLKINNLRKEYPGVVALNDFSFEVRRGEVHALIGENGAGKSTLIKCIAGAISPTAGSLTIDGSCYNAMEPQLARKLGVEVIYQEFNLVPSISAAENVFLNEKTSPGILINIKDRECRAAALFADMGVHVNPSCKIRELSPASQQVVEIAKAVSRNVKVLIMDEPTAPLTVSEVDMLFKIVRDLKSKGVTIIYISHRLEELFEIADRVTVMRDGAFVQTLDIADTNRKQLIGLMAGRTLTESYPSRETQLGDEIMRIENLSGNGVEGINFSLHRGEILGVAGLVGAGRTELMEVIFGAKPRTGGKVIIGGKDTRIKEPMHAISAGIGLIPEDRKVKGAFLRQTIKWNCSIGIIKKLCKGTVVNQAKEIELANSYCTRLGIKTPSIDQTVGNLSGGNQQKVVLAKTLSAKSEIIIFDEPTRGIDVGAKQEIYKLMNELVGQGNAIIMVSSEMPELLGMSDRLIVIAEGKQMGTLVKEQFDQNYILDLASGGHEIVEENV